MLSNTSIEVGGQVADVATANGKYYTVKPDTALAIICDQLQPLNYEYIENSGDEEVAIEIKRISQAPTPTFDPHTAEMDNIVKGIASRLSSNIKYIKKNL